MSLDATNGTDRRTFLQAGALASAAALATSPMAFGQAPAKPAILPTRKLGKTGLDVTLLNFGSGGRDHSTLGKLLRLAYANGVRTFDTARAYGSEPSYKQWFEAEPEVRKTITLVTKDNVKKVDDLAPMVDKRLAALGIDTIDIFFIHGLGDDQQTTEEAIELSTSKEFQKAVEGLKKAGKIKFMGFSTHHRDRARIIQAAADANSVDVIMLQYTPWLEKESALNKALDACHAKEIGLISMKQVAGNFPQRTTVNILDEVRKKVPMLKERNLSPYQGLLHAIWTDERISCSCVSLRTTDQIREDADAARRYEPVKVADIRALRDAVLAHNPMLCADCDGRCSVAAGTNAELGNLTRFLTYSEFHGDRAEARAQYAKLSPEARDWRGADLQAAQAACPNNLNFSELLPEADKVLS